MRRFVAFVCSTSAHGWSQLMSPVITCDITLSVCIHTPAQPCSALLSIFHENNHEIAQVYEIASYFTFFWVKIKSWHSSWVKATKFSQPLLGRKKGNRPWSNTCPQYLYYDLVGNTCMDRVVLFVAIKNII